MPDEITLTLPRDRPFHGVANLVVGGIAARHDVTLEDLADLQLALDELLRANGGAGELNVRFQIEAGRITTVVGPFDEKRLQLELEPGGGDERLSLGRVLETVADRVNIARRDGSAWVELTKTVGKGAPDGDR